MRIAGRGVAAALATIVAAAAALHLRMERLRRVGEQLTQEVPAAAQAENVSSPQPGGPRLLSASELRNFVTDGVLVLRPTELELEPGFHAAVLAKTQALLHTEAGTPELLRHGQLMQALPELNRLCAAPTVQGAMISVLGEDYVQHPHRHLHHPAAHINPGSNVDQPFHKDGNHIPMRDHRPRHAMLMYYPTDTTLEMGPTAVVDGSQYFEFNKMECQEGSLAGPEPAFCDSDSVLPGLNQRAARSRGDGLLPERPSSAGVWDKRVKDAMHTLAAGNAAERDALLEASGRCFGRRQRKLVVPAGSLALIHFDLLHRASRQSLHVVDVPWRPMLKLQYFRTALPTKLLIRDPSSVDASEAAPFAYTGAPLSEQAIWTATWNWLRGTSSPPAAAATSGGPVEIALLGATVRDSDQETERVGAAYRLALCNSIPAVQELAKLFVESGKAMPGRTAQHSQDEATLRACHYGLGAFSPEVVAPRLLELLELELHEHSAIIPSSLASSSSSVSQAEIYATGARYNRIKRLCHALGLCLSQPGSIVNAAGSDSSTVLLSAAVETLTQARAHVYNALTTYAKYVHDNSITPAEGAGSPQRRTVANGSVVVGEDAAAEWVQFEPDDVVGAELRSTHATCVQALGLVAEVAVATSNISVCMSILDELTAVLSSPEPGANLTVRMGSSVREQAGIGLLSLAGGQMDAHARMVAPNEPSGGAFAVQMTDGWVCGYVAEAIARLRRAVTPSAGGNNNDSGLSVRILASLEKLGVSSTWWGKAIKGEAVPFCLFGGQTHC